jgi:hypothetical protein
VMDRIPSIRMKSPSPRPRPRHCAGIDPSPAQRRHGSSLNVSYKRKEDSLGGKFGPISPGGGDNHRTRRDSQPLLAVAGARDEIHSPLASFSLLSPFELLEKVVAN